MRIDVLRGVECRKRRERSRLEIEQRELIGTEAQEAQIARESIGDEREAAAIRRPGRLKVGERIVRDAAQLPRVQVVRVQMRQAALEGRKGHRIAAGRPARGENFPQLRQRDGSVSRAFSHVEDEQYRCTASNRGNHEPVA